MGRTKKVVQEEWEPLEIQVPQIVCEAVKKYSKRENRLTRYANGIQGSGFLSNLLRVAFISRAESAKSKLWIELSIYIKDYRPKSGWIFNSSSRTIKEV